MDDRQAKAAVAAAFLMLAAIFCTLWYSHEEKGEGTVDAKWTEAKNCDEDGCFTYYYVQFEDGRIYDVLLGTLQWDSLRPGDRIRFSARGYHAKFLGWRIGTPTIFSFEKLE